jgi:hypothetical protein
MHIRNYSHEPEVCVCNLRCLNLGKLQNVLTKIVLDLTIQILAQRGKVDGNIRRRGAVSAHLENNLLCLVITNREIEELDAIFIGRERA